MYSMGDLLGFENYMNTTTPFAWKEHNAIWKTDRQYWDFDVVNNKRDDTCVYPRSWSDAAEMYGRNVTDNFDGCLASDFSQVRTFTDTDVAVSADPVPVWRCHKFRRLSRIPKATLKVWSRTRSIERFQSQCSHEVEGLFLSHNSHA